MPLLRAESGEKEAQVGLEATKDGCTPIAKAVVLSRAPDEALVVDVVGGLNSCDVIKQADTVLVKTASRSPALMPSPPPASLPLPVQFSCLMLNPLKNVFNTSKAGYDIVVLARDNHSIFKSAQFIIERRIL